MSKTTAELIAEYQARGGTISKVPPSAHQFVTPERQRKDILANLLERAAEINDGN